MPHPVEIWMRNLNSRERSRQPLTQNECNSYSLPRAQIEERVVETGKEGFAMLSMVLVVVVMTVVLGWCVVWRAMGGRTRMHLTIGATVSRLDPRKLVG